MDSFPKNLAEARIYLSKLKAWAVIATVASLILVSFYSYQGWQYWKAWDELSMLSLEKEQISAKLSEGTPEVMQIADDLELQQQRLAQFEEMFDQSDSNRLIGMLSSISWETGVELPSISAGTRKPENIGANQYQTQPISMTVQGEIEDIYTFILTLQERLPIVSLANISVSSPGEAANAQISLVFYLSPEPIAGAGGAN